MTDPVGECETEAGSGSRGRRRILPSVPGGCHMRLHRFAVLAVVFSAVAASARAQTPGQTATQTQQDEYTEYALLAPDTASFKILYDVTSTTSGAKTVFNPIRKG